MYPQNMFTVIVWIIVVILGISVITSAIRKGGLDFGDLLQLFGIAVGVLTALYSMSVQSVLVERSNTETPTTAIPLNTPTGAPTETFTEVELTATKAWIVTETPTAVVPTTNTPTSTPTHVLPSTPIPISTETSIATNTSLPILLPTTALPSVTSTSTATIVPITSPEAHIIVKGIGAASDNESNPALRERGALLAAELDAKRQLAEWVEGAIIESITITEKGTLTEDTIRQSIKAKVPPYSVIEKKYDSTSGIGYVTLELIVEPN